MAVRNKRKCGNCPEPLARVVAVTPQVGRPPEPRAVQGLYLATSDEGQRLWKHVCFGTSTCISMIEGYALMQMPGDPTEALKQMRDRLDKVLTALEQANAPVDSAERPSPSSPTDDPSPELEEDG